MTAMTSAAETAAALPLEEYAPGGTIEARIGPAGRAILAVHATCLLLALAYPQALASWLDDFEPNPVVDAAQGCVGRLTAVSESLGLAQVSGSLRDLGRRITRKPE